MPTPLEFQVTLDCADPHVLAEWWAETLGWDVEPTNEAFIRQMIAAGHASDAASAGRAGRQRLPAEVAATLQLARTGGNRQRLRAGKR